MAGAARTVVWLVVIPGLVLVTVVAAGAWMVFKRPFAVDAWSTRRALARHGLQRQWVSFDQGRVAVWQGGTGPTMLLLHGAGDQAGTWADIVPALIGDHHLLIPDLPGHADSDPTEGPLGVGTVLAGVEAVLEGQAQEAVTIVGNSLGGWIAMLLAADGGHGVERLVLVNGGALRGESEVNLMPADRAEAATLMAKMRSPQSAEVPDFVLDDLVRQMGSGPVARFYAAAAEMEGFLLEDRLDQVQVPVDLLWGADDQVVPLSYAHRLRGGLAAVRLTTIPDCGHVPQRECPAAFAGALARVLAQPPPTPAAETAPTSETP